MADDIQVQEDEATVAYESGYRSGRASMRFDIMALVGALEDYCRGGNEIRLGEVQKLLEDISAL